MVNFVLRTRFSRQQEKAGHQGAVQYVGGGKIKTLQCSEIKTSIQVKKLVRKSVCNLHATRETFMVSRLGAALVRRSVSSFLHAAVFHGVLHRLA